MPFSQNYHSMICSTTNSILSNKLYTPSLQEAFNLANAQHEVKKKERGCYWNMYPTMIRTTTLTFNMYIYPTMISTTRVTFNTYCINHST